MTAPVGDVSVVITTYNHARYLGEAIESVLAQTVGARQIIVVDDGSTDHPERVTAAYDGVTLIQQPNQGLSTARNIGLEAVQETFVTFLDADDRLLPPALETGLECFAQNPDCGLVYGAYNDIDRAGNLIAARPLRRIDTDAFLDLLPGNLIGMHATVVYRSDRLREVGGFDPRMRSFEDHDAYLRMALGYGIACHDHQVAEYRRHDTNRSHNAGEMLHFALQGLRKYQLAAQSRPSWQKGFDSAPAHLKEHYARVQAQSVRRCLAAGNWPPGELRSLLHVFRLAPATLLRKLLVEFTR